MLIRSTMNGLVKFISSVSITEKIIIITKSNMTAMLANTTERKILSFLLGTFVNLDI